MGRPVEGNSQFQHKFNDVQYRFISAKHQELFSGDPDKYAPRYNGLCAMGLGVNGYKVEANPENWVIHNGQLYVTQRSFGPPSFRKAPERWIVAAQAYERVLDKAQIGTGISWW
jgi:YHS domain-containing protein